MRWYVLLHCIHLTKDQFVDTRQLRSINDSMWSTFEEFHASLFFTCHQWLGTSALRNRTRHGFKLATHFSRSLIERRHSRKHHSTFLRPLCAVRCRWVTVSTASASIGGKKIRRLGLPGCNMESSEDKRSQCFCF